MNEEIIKAHGIDLLDLVEESSRVYIWRAIQKNLDRSVMLVILKEEPSADARETEYFLQIARQFAKLKCESLAAIFDIVSENNLHYVVMENVEGQTLDEIIRDEGRLPFNRVMQVATAITGSLKQLWNTSRIIHRNLKGSTIRFDSRGIAKLMDFSLAIIDSPDFDHEVIDKGHILGAPSFLSPEQAKGEALASVQSDMYSLGALLYYISTGKAPFAGLSIENILASHISWKLPPPHLEVPGLPVNFSRLLFKMMMKDPSRRYINWEELHHDLHCLMDGREPVCAKPNLDYISSIEPDFSEPERVAEEQPPSFKIKTRKRNEYLAGMQDRHVSHHHEADKKNSRNTFQLVMWVILLCWLVILFWFRAVIQVNPHEKEKLLNKRRQIGSVIEELIPGRDNRDNPAAAAESTPATDTRVTDRDNASSGIVPTEPMPPALLDSMAQALKAGDVPDAIALLEQAASYYPGSGYIANQLKNLPAEDELVARHLRNNIGKPLVLNIKGTPRTVVCKGVNDNAVQLEANGRTVDFEIAKLTPEQKSNWIGTPQNTGESIVLCILLLQTPLAEEAAKYAQECGPLAPVILKASKLTSTP